jgi:hypothetical protein
MPVHAQTYRVVQTQSAGANQTVQILQDSRLTQGMADQMWFASTDPGFVFGEDSPIALSAKKLPLLPAKLVLLDSAGKELSSFVPEDVSPLARIEDRQLPGAILVTTDDSAGFGSYSGLRTHLLQATGGKITPVFATDDKAKSSPIELSKTLKALWRVETRQGSEQLLQIFCDPDFEHADPHAADMPFVVTYITFRYENGAWHRSERQESGFWESDQEFPEDRFP